MTVTDEGVLGQVPGGKVWGLDEAEHCSYNRMWLYPYSVWMLCSELKVPLARLWILLSYSDSSAKFSRSLKSDALMQWILLAFSNLEDNNSVTRCAGGTSERQQRRPADSQKLQRGQTIKHTGGQLRDLITIQNPAAEQLELCSVLMF